jgi:hypothetical protein
VMELNGADVRALVPLGATVFVLSVAAQYRHAMRAFRRLNRALRTDL